MTKDPERLAAAKKRRNKARADLRSRGLCIECRNPSPNYTRCKTCRGHANDLIAAKMDDAKRLEINEYNRTRRAHRREKWAECPRCGGELPCLDCARYDRERKEAVRGPVTEICTKCRKIGHRSTSLLCPLRFGSLPIEEFALARTET